MSRLSIPHMPFLNSLTSLSAGLDSVDSPSSEWVNMAIRWDHLHDLLGGTLVMRLQGEKWLPKEPLEEFNKYEIRLQRGVLFEGFKDTITRLCSKPFSKEVTTKGSLSNKLEPMISNIDRQGTDLTGFCKDLMFDALVHGKTHFLVDFPRTDGTQTSNDEIFGGVRPYFNHVKAEDLIGWRSIIDPVSGEKILTQIRIKENDTSDLGDFATEEVERVRVFERGSFRVFEKTSKDREFIVVNEGEMKIGSQRLERIPLVTIYFNRTKFLQSLPPLEGLGWLNIAHWQSSTDHRNYLRFARIGILSAFGFSNEEIEDGVKISPNGLTYSTNPAAKLEYVEHEGRAFEAGLKDLEMLEERMEVLGLQPLVEGTASSTATGKVIDEGKQDSQVQSWIRAVEHGIEDGFRLAHLWVNEEMNEEFEVNIFNEFSISIRAATDIDHLIRMRTSVPPQISHETFINEVRRRNVLAESVDPEKEEESINQEMIDALSFNSENIEEDD